MIKVTRIKDLKYQTPVTKKDQNVLANNIIAYFQQQGFDCTVEVV